MDKKYFKVTLTLKIEEDAAAAGLQPFTATTVEYDNMPIEGVAAIERELIGTLGRLRDFGDKQIEAGKAAAPTS